MDDRGIADAFYTVLSIGIVLVAALAVSGVVLSATAGQGKDAGGRIAEYTAQGSLKPGLYCFYYAVDEAESDITSGDPNDIALERLASQGTSATLAFDTSSAPPSAPEAAGAVIWSGFLYTPQDDSYQFALASAGPAWLWVDGRLMAENGNSGGTEHREFTLALTKGYHRVKAKYYYPELSLSSCQLTWMQGGHMAPVGSFYR